MIKELLHGIWNVGAVIGCGIMAFVFLVAVLAIVLGAWQAFLEAAGSAIYRKDRQEWLKEFRENNKKDKTDLGQS